MTLAPSGTPIGLLEMENIEQPARRLPSLPLARADVAEPLAIFLATRLGLILVAYMGLVFLPSRSTPDVWHEFPNNLFLDGWLRWDSGWFLSIVRVGYEVHPLPLPSNVAFFPLYPLAIKALSLVLPDALAALVVANLAFLLAVFLFYRLVAALYNATVARRATLLLCLSPFAFFLGAAYSEPLFLLTSVATFYFGERQRWLLAALCALLGSATRLVGLGLFPALVLLYWESVGFDLRRVRLNAGWTLLAPLGTLAYEVYLYVRFGDLLLLPHVETAQGWSLQTTWDLSAERELIAALLQANLAGGTPHLLTTVTVVLATAFILASLAAARWLRPSYAIYALGILLIPYFSTNLDSLGRFCAVAFPVFILAARFLRHELAFQLVLLVSALLLPLFTVLFANWYWAG